MWENKMLRDVRVKAGKLHRCHECGREIRHGELHSQVVGVCYGDLVDYRVCLFCRRVADDLRDMGYCVPLNGLWELVGMIEREEV